MCASPSAQPAPRAIHPAPAVRRGARSQCHPFLVPDALLQLQCPSDLQRASGSARVWARSVVRPALPLPNAATPNTSLPLLHAFARTAVCADPAQQVVGGSCGEF